MQNTANHDPDAAMRKHYDELVAQRNYVKAQLTQIDTILGYSDL